MSTITMESHPTTLNASSFGATIKDSIVNRAGDLVKIEDLLLDMEKGRAAFATLSYAGGLNVDKNKDLCRRFLEKVVNEGDLSLIGDFLSPDVVSHELADSLGDAEPLQGQGIEWVADLVHLYRHAFPDLNFEVQDQIAEGDQVVTCLRMHGTQTNSLMAIAASGRKVDVGGIRVDRIADGKIVESWFHIDMMAMLHQLKALPALNRQPQKVSPVDAGAVGSGLPISQLPQPTFFVS